MSISTFGAQSLEGVEIQIDDAGEAGIRQKRKFQNAQFYWRKHMAFRCVYVKDGEGKPIKDLKTGEFLVELNPKTQLPKQEPYEKIDLMVRVRNAGDPTEIDVIALPEHKKLFFRQYKKFLDENGELAGHMIDEFDFINPNTVMDLHYYGLHTLEQVAVANDLVCQQIPELWELRDMAKRWIQINSPGGFDEQLAKSANELLQLKTENEKLRSQLMGAGRQPFPVASDPLNAVPGADQVIVEAPIRTGEVSLEDFKKGRGRPRKV